MIQRLRGFVYAVVMIAWFVPGWLALHVHTFCERRWTNTYTRFRRVRS